MISANQMHLAGSLDEDHLQELYHIYIVALDKQLSPKYLRHFLDALVDCQATLKILILWKKDPFDCAGI